MVSVPMVVLVTMTLCAEHFGAWSKWALSNP
jgi:hypothetical protein